jgi:glycosyltransferase involved in cell wall biosynthesis
MTKVSVVVPCRNEAEFIEGLLDAVREQDFAPLETIVVDNGSIDGTEAILERYAARHPGFPLVITSCRAEGAAAAMNHGIRAARGDVIVRLDGHSVPQSDYIRRCVTRLQDPNAGVVGGVWEIVPRAATLRARAIALAVGSRLGSGGAAYRHGDAHDEPKDVDTVPFGCYTRALWAELDGYDDTLLVVEDGEFNYRVREAGHRVILDPAIRCTYFPRRRFRTLARQYFHYGWWKIPMLVSHPQAIRVRQMIPLLFVAWLTAVGLVSLVVPGMQYLLAATLAVYGAAILGSAFQVASRAGDRRLVVPVAMAFAIIHLAWGGGGLLHLVTLGRWPPWRLRLRPRTA